MTLCHFLCHYRGMAPSIQAGSTGIAKLVAKHHSKGGYRKVYDASKRRIRGLWVRNGRYYARLTVEDFNTGKTQVMRVPLDGAATVPQAAAKLRKLLTQRETNALPVLRQTPKIGDYVKNYFAHYELVAL